MLMKMMMMMKTAGGNENNTILHHAMSSNLTLAWMRCDQAGTREILAEVLLVLPTSFDVISIDVIE